MSTAGPPTLAFYLHGPAMILSCWVSTLYCMHTQPNLHQNAHVSEQKKSTLKHILIVGVSYAVEVLAVSCDSSCVGDVHFGRNAVHAMAMVLTCACLGLDWLLLDRILWLPYMGAWTLGGFFECAFGVWTFLEPSSFRDGCGLSLLLFRCSRALSSLAFFAGPMSLLAQRESSTHDEKDASTQQQSQNVRRGLLKSTTILIGILYSCVDSKTYVYGAVITTHYVAARFLDVVRPRHVLRIVENPSWANIAVWFLLRWLDSPAGLHWVKKWAHQQLRSQFDGRMPSFRHAMGLSWHYHTNTSTAQTIMSIQSSASLSRLIHLILDSVLLLLDVLVTVSLITGLFEFSVAYLVFVVWVSYIWLGAALTVWSQRLRRGYSESFRDESHVSHDTLSNWITVSTHNQTGHEAERFQSAILHTEKCERTWISRTDRAIGIRSLVLTLGFLGVTILVRQSTGFANKAYGSVLALWWDWSAATQPMVLYETTCSQWPSIMNQLESLISLLDTKPAVVSGQNRLDRIKGGEIEFRNVHFSYDESKEVLTDLNFVVKPGQTVAFVGSSGGGKSTILGLILRLFDPTHGRILIDGQPLRSLALDSLRDSVGAVLQDSSVFDRTVMENVKYAKPDATDEEVYQACQAALLHDRIISLPHGYNSPVGVNGEKLSGGERQRLCIARVLLKKCAIILLDEATSAMDSITEAGVVESIRAHEGQTSVTVAHRLSAIKDSDVIFVLDGGRIVERGNHDELMKRNGKYSVLWKLQSGSG